MLSVYNVKFFNDGPAMLYFETSQKEKNIEFMDFLGVSKNVTSKTCFYLAEII